MSGPHEKLARLRRYNLAVQQKDPKLAEESRDTDIGLEVFAEAPSPEAAENQIELESIIMRRERPVLAIKENVTQLVFVDEAESEIWRSRLSQAKPLLDDAIRAVGRVNLTGGQLDWVGTGWLVAENVIVTNRHVAWEFAERGGDGFTFKMGLNEQIAADIDFLQEIESPARLVFQLVKPLHIEDAPGPDVAFFEVMTVSGNAKLAKPIDLAASIAASQNVATIGYPAYDSRIPEPELMERIYGKIYNKKRLAPGGVTRVEQTRVWHNCTTLGGNSGSVVLDLDNGNAIGLHFSGSFLATNYAVRADIVKKMLGDMRAGRAGAKPQAPAREQRPRVPFGDARPSKLGAARAGRHREPDRFHLILNISLAIDHDRAVGPSRPGFAPPTGRAGRAYRRDRSRCSRLSQSRGLRSQLSWAIKSTVELPTVTRDADDILEFECGGGQKPSSSTNTTPSS